MQVQLKKEVSLTQTYSPKYRKKLSKIYDSNQIKVSWENLEQIRDVIIVDIKKINGLIDGVESTISNRVQFHQQQILKIVREQLHKMQMDVDNVVQKYNELLRQKSISEQIWELRGQVDAYKKVLFKLNQQNQKLRNQNKQLQSRLQTREDRTDQQNQVLKKIMKKLIRQKQKHNNIRKKFVTQPRVSQTLLTQLQNQRTRNQSDMKIKSPKKQYFQVEKSVQSSSKKWNNSMNCSKIVKSKQTSVPLKILKAEQWNNNQEFSYFVNKANTKLSKLKPYIKSVEINPQSVQKQQNNLIYKFQE